MIFYLAFSRVILTTLRERTNPAPDSLMARTSAVLPDCRGLRGGAAPSLLAFLGSAEKPVEALAIAPRHRILASLPSLEVLAMPSLDNRAARQSEWHPMYLSNLNAVPLSRFYRVNDVFCDASAVVWNCTL